MILPDDGTEEIQGRNKIVARHVKERKALEQQQKAELKKCSDRTGKKILQEKHDAQKQELAAKQASELKGTSLVGEQCEELTHNTETDAASTVVSFYSSQAAPSRSLTKKKKKQDQLESTIEQLAASRADVSLASRKETVQIEAALEAENFGLFQITGDGHCLFRAIEHQLRILNKSCYTYLELRELASTYILNNKDDFGLYYTGYNLDDSKYTTTTTLEDHCKDIKDSASWGGEFELTALSKCLGCDIEIISANSPKVCYSCGLSDGPPITLTFHQYQYSSGGHYNSTFPKL